MQPRHGVLRLRVKTITKGPTLDHMEAKQHFGRHTGKCLAAHSVVAPETHGDTSNANSTETRWKHDLSRMAFIARPDRLGLSAAQRASGASKSFSRHSTVCARKLWPASTPTKRTGHPRNTHNCGFTRLATKLTAMWLILRQELPNGIMAAPTADIRDHRETTAATHATAHETKPPPARRWSTPT